MLSSKWYLMHWAPVALFCWKFLARGGDFYQLGSAQRRLLQNGPVFSRHARGSTSYAKLLVINLILNPCTLNTLNPMGWLRAQGPSLSKDSSVDSLSSDISSHT